MKQNFVASFQKDHNSMKPGIYKCPKIFPFIETYDLRFLSPNTEFLSPAVCHSVEHILACYFKEISKYSNEVVSLNIGACRTMAYLELVSNHKMNVEEEIISALKWACTLTKVPYATKKTCGNYRSHNLEGAIWALYLFVKALPSFKRNKDKLFPFK